MTNKIVVSFLAFLFFTGIFSSCINTSKKAASYNEKIVNEQIKLQNCFNEFEATFEDYKKEEMTEKLRAASLQADSSLAFFKGMDDFDGNTELKNASINFATMYKSLASEEFAILVDRYSLPDSLFTSQVEKECYNLLSEIDKKYNEAYNNLLNAQSEFAKTYNIKIESPK